MNNGEQIGGFILHTYISSSPTLHRFRVAIITVPSFAPLERPNPENGVTTSGVCSASMEMLKSVVGCLSAKIPPPPLPPLLLIGFGELLPAAKGDPNPPPNLEFPLIESLLSFC